MTRDKKEILHKSVATVLELLEKDINMLLIVVLVLFYIVVYSVIV